LSKEYYENDEKLKNYHGILMRKALLYNMCLGKVSLGKDLISFLFILDKMGKKHHIGGTTRILTFLVVVSIIYSVFTRLILHSSRPALYLFMIMLLLFLIS
jgi:hypothetical protein